ncbi:hypothetical protein BaRGS_00026549 [Batillaria attramentaria]|uniref:Uncharacterized protein n=1 Tax=Batillaria attramentaria TaxID=370345 RepID=A0ABD0K5J8_9CAEN
MGNAVLFAPHKKLFSKGGVKMDERTHNKQASFEHTERKERGESCSEAAIVRFTVYGQHWRGTQTVSRRTRKKLDRANCLFDQSWKPRGADIGFRAFKRHR